MAFNKNKKIVTTALTAAMVASAVAPVAAAKLTPAQDATKAVDGYYKLSVKTRADVSNSAKVKKAALAKVAKLTSKKDAKLKASLTAKVAKKSAAINKYYQTVIVAAENEAKAIAAVEAFFKTVAGVPVTAETTKEQVEQAYAQALALIAKVKTPAKVTEFKTAADKMKTDALAKIEELATPKVASVTAINGKQLEVKFNKAVDANTVIGVVGTDDTLEDGVFNITRVPVATDDVATPADETLKNVVANAAGAVLSTDGKTLTITAAGNTYFDGQYAITVSDAVKDTTGKTLTTYSGVVTAADKTAPTVTGVSYDVTSGKVSVKFSEKLATAPTTVRLNNQPVTLDAFTAGSDTVTFTNTATAGTTASVYVAGAADFTGNVQGLFNGSVAIAQPSTTALSVTSLTQVDSNVVRVVFDKAVAGTAAVSAADIQDSLTILKDGQSLAGADFTVTRVASDTTNKTFDVTVNVAAAGAPAYGIYGTGTTKTLSLVLADQGITDIFGNKNGVYNQSITLTKDAVGPTVATAKLADDKKSLEVTFNENLKTGSVVDSNIVVRRDGISQTVVAATDIKAGAGNEKVLSIQLTATDLNADGTLKAGVYSIRLEAGAVKDNHSNDSAFANSSVTVSGSVSTSPLTVTGVVNPVATSNTFEVTYSEEVTASALNLANYTLDGTVLPANTDIYFKDATKKVVVIKLQAGSVNIGKVGTGTNAVLSVANVVDTQGDVVAAKASTVKIEDNTSALLTGAQIVGDTLVFTFSENIDDASKPTTFAGLVAAFDIKGAASLADGVTPGGETIASSVSGNKLTVTITGKDDSNWDAVKAAGTVTVSTKTGITLEDANDVAVKAATTVTASK